MYPNLRAELKRANMTSQELALIINRSSSGFSQKLTGRFDFSLKEMRKIRDLLGERTGQKLSLDYLFKED